jgi:hypothetical protein
MVVSFQCLSGLLLIKVFLTVLLMPLATLTSNLCHASPLLRLSTSGTTLALPCSRDWDFLGLVSPECMRLLVLLPKKEKTCMIRICNKKNKFVVRNAIYLVRINRRKQCDATWSATTPTPLLLTHHSTRFFPKIKAKASQIQGPAQTT